MTIETISSSDHSLYEGDSNSGYNYLTPRMSVQERMINLHRSQLMDILELSTLSDDDKQRLRRLSAGYVVACAPLDEDDESTELRRTILDNLSADIPELSNTGMMGLRRALSKEHPVTILIDGQPLTMTELEVVYSAIEPSKEVLDLAAESAAYFSVYDDADTEMPVEKEPVEPKEPQPYEGEEWNDYDIFEVEPIFDDKHTLRDELRPITGELVKLGRKVVSIVGLHSPAEHRRAA
jgi:hypothetical protein